MSFLTFGWLASSVGGAGCGPGSASSMPSWVPGGRLVKALRSAMPAMLKVPGAHRLGELGDVEGEVPALVVVPAELPEVFVLRQGQPVGLELNALVQVALGVQRSVPWPARRPWWSPGRSPRALSGSRRRKGSGWPRCRRLFSSSGVGSGPRSRGRRKDQPGIGESRRAGVTAVQALTPSVLRSTSEKNRLGSAIGAVSPRIEAHIAWLEQELSDLDRWWRGRWL